MSSSRALLARGLAFLPGELGVDVDVGSAILDGTDNRLGEAGEHPTLEPEAPPGLPRGTRFPLIGCT